MNFPLIRYALENETRKIDVFVFLMDLVGKVLWIRWKFLGAAAQYGLVAKVGLALLKDLAIVKADHAARCWMLLSLQIHLILELQDFQVLLIIKLNLSLV